MSAHIIPVSLVIPTRNRSTILRRALDTFAQQSVQPSEIVLVDASPDRSTYDLCVASSIPGLVSKIRYARAEIAGAAVQRNQGVALAREAVIGFCDDDILLELDCVARLWNALQSDPRMGGVNATITNQRYQPPGLVSRLLFTFMAGKRPKSFAGMMLGPAINLLPEDDNALPDIVPVEWLNLGLTFYRREALPNPPFSAFFTGYSMMEDAALSWRVGQSWKLANARTARLFHDSQAGGDKSDPVAMSRMELVNRYHVMTHVLGRKGFADYCRLAVWELFQLFVSGVHSRGGREFWRMLSGKIQAAREITRHKSMVQKT